MLPAFTAIDEMSFEFLLLGGQQITEGSARTQFLKVFVL
jgi:hypothetical protein